jgi:DNA-binding NarL/FixJ family response regulator
VPARPTDQQVLAFHINSAVMQKNLSLRAARRALPNPEICERLVISEATAKTHVARILQKLDLRDRIQAVIYAYETGLIAPRSIG